MCENVYVRGVVGNRESHKLSFTMKALGLMELQREGRKSNFSGLRENFK